MLYNTKMTLFNTISHITLYNHHETPSRNLYNTAQTPHLFLLFRKSMDEPEVPDDWKCAVSPIYKKGNISSTENYCPVSLTSLIYTVSQKKETLYSCPYLC